VSPGMFRPLIYYVPPERQRVLIYPVADVSSVTKDDCSRSEKNSAQDNSLLHRSYPAEDSIGRENGKSGKGGQRKIDPMLEDWIFQGEDARSWSQDQKEPDSQKAYN